MKEQKKILANNFFCHCKVAAFPEFLWKKISLNISSAAIMILKKILLEFSIFINLFHTFGVHLCVSEFFFCVMIIMCRISNGLIFLWIWCHLTRSTCTHYINKRLNENSFIILNRTRFAIQKLRGRKFKWLKSIKRLLIMRRMWICINIGALFSFHHWKMEQ